MAALALVPNSLAEVNEIVRKLNKWSQALPEVLVNRPQLRKNLARAADSVAEKAWERMPGRLGSRATMPIPRPRMSVSGSTEEVEQSPLFFPDSQQDRVTHVIDETTSTNTTVFSTPLKRKISALSVERSDLGPTAERGRRQSSMLASFNSSASPRRAPSTGPEECPETPREPSSCRTTTRVAYVDIYKYGRGLVANITDIVLDALDFASKGLLPLAISGSFNKGMEVWAHIGLQPQDEERYYTTDIRRRDEPWEAGTMIARITYDPTTLDLSRDECFDVHFSDEGKGSIFKMRRSTGTWQGHFPSDIILAENFGVTHYVKVWDPFLPVDKLTKPTRLPPSMVMRCRKAKCDGDNVMPVERHYASPLDPCYVSRFEPDRDYGDGGWGLPYSGGGGGDNNDRELDDDDDRGRGDKPNDADNDEYEEKRLRIEKLTAICNANLEARKAEQEARKHKGKVAAKGKINGKMREDGSRAPL